MQTPHDYNPYQAPKSDMSHDKIDGEYELLEDPNRLSVSAGIAWVSQAWQIFMTRPLLWIGTTLVFGIIILILSLLGVIPIIGLLFTILAGAISPMFIAGFCYIAYNIEYEQETGFNDLFIAFQNKFSDFLMLWLFNFLLTLIIGFIVSSIVFIFGFGVSISIGSILNSDDVAGLFIILIALALMVFILPLLMMSYYAPVLILFHDLKAWDSMKLSFKACLANMLPFLSYGIIALIMLIIGSIPLMLGLLVVIPILIISIYISYRQILINN